MSEAANSPKSKTGPGGFGGFISGVYRPHGGARSRFVGTSHHGNEQSASLKPEHPAVVEGRTLFPSRVIAADKAPRVLVSGHNNAKIGARVEKGEWAGMPILTLTLEERKTCPRTCAQWRSCFGNAMPMPRRHAHGDALVRVLDKELRDHARRNPGGFVVRLHILGDFYSTEYVRHWRQWMLEIPPIRVFGYTARLPGTEIGRELARNSEDFPTRWRIRTSVARSAAHGPMQVDTAWKANGELPELPSTSIWCPQQ